MEAATKPTKPKVTSLDKGLPAFYRGGLTADTKSLATALPPLPETADELRRVAREFGAKAEDIYLREAASVPNVKHAPLDKYRVVYFATHALVAGEVKKFAKARAEPALVLSIPEKPTHEDDGLLRASDVAMLRMNADFVVLSACNTAAGDKPGAEALSGLARAFLYAGARSLIVSNWEVDSESTVALMTDLFDALKNDPHLSHAEALWLSMLRMIDNPPQSEWTQPRFWAPFVVVGEPQKDWMIHSHFSRSFTGWRSFLATSSAYTRDPRPTTKYVDKLPSSWGPRRIEPSSTDPAGEDITAARRDP